MVFLVFIVHLRNSCVNETVPGNSPLSLMVVSRGAAVELVSPGETDTWDRTFRRHGGRTCYLPGGWGHRPGEQETISAAFPVFSLPICCLVEAGERGSEMA